MLRSKQAFSYPNPSSAATGRSGCRRRSGSTSKRMLAVPPVVRRMGNVPGSLSVKTMGWALYVSPAVPLQVPVSGKVNCGVTGGERSPCSSAIIRRLSGTHSPAEPIATWTPSVSCEPEIDRVRDGHRLIALRPCDRRGADRRRSRCDDDGGGARRMTTANASVDDAVELRRAASERAVLVPKMSAFGPSSGAHHIRPAAAIEHHVERDDDEHPRHDG